MRGSGFRAAGAALLGCTLLGAALSNAPAQEMPAERVPTHVDISEDGRLVVYAEELKQGVRTLSVELRAVNPDGTGDRLLTTVPSLWDLDLSPDGKSVVFVRRDEGDGDLWVIGTDGGGLRQVTRTRGTEQRPRFTAEGTGVLYVREEAAQLFAPRAGYHLDLATGAERKILDSSYEPREIGPIRGILRGWYALTRPLNDDGAPQKNLPFDYKPWILRLNPEGGRPTVVSVPPGGLKVDSLQAGQTDRFDWYLLQAEEKGLPVAHLMKGVQVSPLPHKWIRRLSADAKLGVGLDIDQNIKFYVALCDLETGKVRPLTGKGAADLQPREALDAGEFGKALRALIAATAEDFAPVRGAEQKPLGNTRYYASSVAVPGLERLYLSIPDRPNSTFQPYASGEFYRGEDREVAARRHQELLALVRPVVEGWPVKTGSEPVSGKPYSYTEWEKDHVRVRVDQSEDSILGHRATLTVRRVFQEPPPPTTPVLALPQAEFREALKQVIAAAPARFEAFKGPQFGDAGSISTVYRSTRKLPGSRDDLIILFTKFADDTYSSEFPIPRTLEGLQASFDALLAAARPVMAGWKAEESVRDQNGTLEKTVSFRNAANTVHIRVQSAYLRNLQFGTLKLTVAKARP